MAPPQSRLSRPQLRRRTWRSRNYPRRMAPWPPRLIRRQCCRPAKSDASSTPGRGGGSSTNCNFPSGKTVRSLWAWLCPRRLRPSKSISGRSWKTRKTWRPPGVVMVFREAWMGTGPPDGLHRGRAGHPGHSSPVSDGAEGHGNRDALSEPVMLCSQKHLQFLEALRRGVRRLLLFYSAAKALTPRHLR